VEQNKDWIQKNYVILDNLGLFARLTSL
jgi:hypothetical protein